MSRYPGVYISDRSCIKTEGHLLIPCTLSNIEPAKPFFLKSIFVKALKGRHFVAQYSFKGALRDSLTTPFSRMRHRDYYSTSPPISVVMYLLLHVYIIPSLNIVRLVIVLPCSPSEGLKLPSNQPLFRQHFIRRNFTGEDICLYHIAHGRMWIFSQLRPQGNPRGNLDPRGLPWGRVRGRGWSFPGVCVCVRKPLVSNQIQSSFPSAPPFEYESHITRNRNATGATGNGQEG